MSKEKIVTLTNFIGNSQLISILDGCKSEEKEYFKNKINEIYQIVSSMPKVYEQDGKGDKAVAYLHYFTKGMNWYITERDISDEQLQAFGLVSMDIDYPELGYIPINNLLSFGVELDLNWTPKTIKEIKKELK